MEITEDENVQVIVEKCRHCFPKTLIPKEYEFTCIAYDYNVMKPKHELSKNQ